jgi:hypothetical protein
LGADCTCKNELECQITALVEETQRWRKLWTFVCGEFYSQQENREQPDLAMIINGKVINEGEGNVLRLNNLREYHYKMPKSIQWKICLLCDEHGKDVEPCIDTSHDLANPSYDCLTCGSPIEKDFVLDYDLEEAIE